MNKLIKKHVFAWDVYLQTLRSLCNPLVFFVFKLFYTTKYTRKLYRARKVNFLPDNKCMHRQVGNLPT